MKTDKTPGNIKLDEKMEVSDGGRLAPKNAPRERESPFFSLHRSPRTTRAIPAEASENAPGLWDNPIDDPGLERFVRLGGTSVLDSDPIICSLLTELIAKNS